MRNLIVVGERSPDHRPAFASPAARKLAALCGLAETELRANARLMNLMEPGKGSWDTWEAALRAGRLLEEVRGARLLLCGANVARAFGVLRLPRYVWYPVMNENEVGPIPHPSGRCHLWNDAGEHRRAEAFLTPLFERPLISRTG